MNYHTIGIGVFLFVLFALRKLYLHFKTVQEESFLKLTHACKPAVSYHDPWRIKNIQEMAEFASKRKLCTLLHYRFQKHPETTTIEIKSIFGGGSTFLTNEPLNIQTILSHQFDNFVHGSVRTRVLAPLTGEGVFTQDGAAWAHSRALLRPTFARDNTSDLESLESHIIALHKKILASPIDDATSGHVVDLEPLVAMLSLDSSTGLLFGQSVNSLAEDSGMGTFSHAWGEAQKCLVRKARAGPFASLVARKEMITHTTVVQKLASQLLERALERYSKTKPKALDASVDKSSYVFIDALLKQTQDKKVLMDQTLNMLLAGRETLSALMAFAFFMLKQHPRVRGKLVAEIGDKYGVGPAARIPSYQDMQDPKSYTLCVLRETLRLYPPAPGNGRECARTTVLPLGGGHDGRSPLLVHKGDKVNYSIYAMHRRHDLFGENADEFWPERWEDDRLKDIGWAFLPFGGGRRKCLGQNLALTECSYVVTRLVQLFPAFEGTENRGGESDQEVLFRVGMTTTIDNGVWITFK